MNSKSSLLESYRLRYEALEDYRHIHAELRKLMRRRKKGEKK